MMKYSANRKNERSDEFETKSSVVRAFVRLLFAILNSVFFFLSISGSQLPKPLVNEEIERERLTDCANTKVTERGRNGTAGGTARATMRTDTMRLIENRINYVVIQYDMSRATRATLVKRRLLDACSRSNYFKVVPTTQLPKVPRWRNCVIRETLP